MKTSRKTSEWGTVPIIIVAVSAVAMLLSLILTIRFFVALFVHTS